MPRSVFYAVIAPKWRAHGRPTPMLGSRRPLRWQVVREVRPTVTPDGITVSGAEHVSLHWTYRSAQKAADRLRGGRDA